MIPVVIMMEAVVKRNYIYLTLLFAALLALPATAQAFQRRPAQEDQRQTKPPEQEPKAPPTAEGAAQEMAKDRITIQQLKQKLDNKEDIVILDVRSNSSYLGSTVKIKGAVRIPPEEIEQRLKELPKDKEIITYCT
jgi:3-mercaptopyruvate sulfurtransferase SseA